jgi:uncharacterized damage-inducible protein DinB
MNAVDRYARSLEQGFEEELSHVPLLRSLEGLTPERAAWKPSPQRKSIWQNVAHIAFWTSYYAGRLGGEAPRPSGWYQDLQWVDVTEVTDERWKETVQAMIRAQEAFELEVRKLSENDLDKPLHGGENPIYEFITVVMTHNSYHCGQIMYLRALQGMDPLD